MNTNKPSNDYELLQIAVEQEILHDKRSSNFSDADLSDADLEGLDLHGVNFWGAKLFGACLAQSNLRRANLINADLTTADLSGADLRDSHLYGAQLQGANLSRANLTGVVLHNSNLSGALGIWFAGGHLSIQGNTIYYWVADNTLMASSGHHFSGTVNQLLIYALDRQGSESRTYQGLKMDIECAKFHLQDLLNPSEGK